MILLEMCQAKYCQSNEDTEKGINRIYAFLNILKIKFGICFSCNFSETSVLNSKPLHHLFCN